MTPPAAPMAPPSLPQTPSPVRHRRLTAPAATGSRSWASVSGSKWCATRSHKLNSRVKVHVSVLLRQRPASLISECVDVSMVFLCFEDMSLFDHSFELRLQFVSKQSSILVQYIFSPFGSHNFLPLSFATRIKQLQTIILTLASNPPANAAASLVVVPGCQFGVFAMVLTFTQSFVKFSFPSQEMSYSPAGHCGLLPGCPRHPQCFQAPECGLCMCGVVRRSSA